MVMPAFGALRRLYDQFYFLSYFYTGEYFFDTWGNPCIFFIYQPASNVPHASKGATEGTSQAAAPFDCRDQ